MDLELLDIFHQSRKATNAAKGHTTIGEDDPTDGGLDASELAQEVAVPVPAGSLQPVAIPGGFESDPVGGGAPATPGVNPLVSAKDFIDIFLNESGTQSKLKGYYQGGAWE